MHRPQKKSSKQKFGPARPKKNTETAEDRAVKRMPKYLIKQLEAKRMERQKMFLKAYEELGNRNVSAACRMTGISRFAVYKWARVYPKFAKQMIMIDEGVMDMTEGALYERIKGG